MMALNTFNKLLKFCHFLNSAQLNAGALLTSLKICQRSYKILIVGGGTGGISVAARLCRFGEKDVTLIEPSEVHYYQPYWTLVGGRKKNFNSTFRPTKSCIPNDVNWIKDKVIDFNASKNLVVTGKHGEINYDFLVVALGLKLGFDKVKGLTEAFNTKGVCSNYSPLTVKKTAQAIEDFTEGNAIFTQPINPIKCAGAPQKIMYLAEENFKKMNKRHKANIIFNTALNTIFSAPKYAAALREVAKNKDITVNYLHSLVEVKPDNREAIFAILDEKGAVTGTKVFKYEMLHVCPPMISPSVISKSNLADSTGFLDVNKFTLQSVKYENIFGLGDCTNVPTSKTAAAVAGQCGVLTDNLKSLMKGQNLSKTYNGYTSCPLVTGYQKGILAEFDFDLQPIETLPIDQGKERYLSYYMKKEMLPILYWNWMLKGYWSGPHYLRKIFHFGMGK